MPFLRRKLELERQTKAEQKQRRIEMLKTSYDVNTLEDKRREASERLETMNKGRESDKRIIELLSAQAEGERELLKKIQQLLCTPQDSIENYRALHLCMIQQIERRLDGTDTKGSQKELLQLDPAFIKLLAACYPKMTVNERKVCALVSTDVSNADIARLMHVSQRSIETYRYRIRKKLNLAPGSDLNLAIARLYEDQ